MNTSIASSQTTTDSKGLKRVMQQHPLLFYFILAYAISWIVFIPYVFAEWGIMPGTYSLFFYTLHTFGPALAAIIMTSIIAGKQACMNCGNVSGSGMHPGTGICLSSWAFQC